MSFTVLTEQSAWESKSIKSKRKSLVSARFPFSVGEVLGTEVAILFEVIK